MLQWDVISMGHNLASSFRLFRLQKFFLHIIANFSKIHNIHLFANVILTKISMVTGFTGFLSLFLQCRLNSRAHNLPSN